MRGCDKFCTICIVPFTRGRERSRSLNSIESEVKQAVKEGFREITLLGQNVNSYKHDQFYFPNLLENVAQIPGVDRIRYTSPHPQDITDELLEVMQEYDNICNYIHLPLQAGSDKILRRMHRSYSKQEFLTLAQKIRKTLPGVGISTDIIVGFPGETQNDFMETINVMKEVRFDSAFNFKYSPRIGTKAFEYEDQIPDHIKQKRLKRVIELQKEHTLIRNKKLIGSTQTILVEKKSKMSNNHWSGRTDSNKWVIFIRDTNVNDFVKVLIKSTKGISLHGELINEVIAA